MFAHRSTLAIGLLVPVAVTSLACMSGGSVEATEPTEAEYVAAYQALDRMLTVRTAIGDQWDAPEAIDYVIGYLPEPAPVFAVVAEEELRGFTREQLSCFADAVTLPEFYDCGLAALAPLFPTEMGQFLCSDGATRQEVELRNGNISERCVYSDGKKHGLVAEWTPSGQLVEIAEMDDRRHVGIDATFHDNGQLRTYKFHSLVDDVFSLHLHENGQVSFLSMTPGHVDRYLSTGIIEHTFAEDGSYVRGNCLSFGYEGREVRQRSRWTSTNRDEVESRDCP